MLGRGWIFTNDGIPPLRNDAGFGLRCFQFRLSCSDPMSNFIGLAASETENHCGAVDEVPSEATRYTSPAAAMSFRCCRKL